MKKIQYLSLNKFFFMMSIIVMFFALTIIYQPQISTFMNSSNAISGNWTDSGYYNTNWLGKGSKQNPYLITSAADLAGIAVIVNSAKDQNLENKYFEQTTNIDLGAHYWIPIGGGQYREDRYFSGNYNGCGYEISNLYINQQDYYCVGLFGKTTGATIKGVNIASGTVNGFGDVAGIVGYSVAIDNEVDTIIYCSNNATINGSERVGGIVGGYQHKHPNYLHISNCYNTANITGNVMIGGILGGQNNNGMCAIIDHCFNTGTIYGDGATNGGKSLVGGIVGRFAGVNGATGAKAVVSGYVRDTWNTGWVSDNTYVGGIAGQFYYAYEDKMSRGTNYFNTISKEWGDGYNKNKKYTSYLDTLSTSSTQASWHSDSQNWYEPWDMTNIWQVSGSSHPTLRKVTLTLDANGGSIPSVSYYNGSGATASRMRTYAGFYGSLPTPIRAGYTFKGWFTEPTGGIQRTAENVFSGGYTTLYAQWEAYTVTFDNTNYVNYPYSVSLNACGGSITNEVVNNEYIVHLTVSSRTNNNSGMYMSVSNKLTVGKKYDWSIYVKSTRSHDIYIGHEQNGLINDKITTEWTQITHTFTASDSSYLAFILYSNNLAVGEVISFKNLSIQESDETKTPADQAIGSLMVTYRGTYSNLPTPTREHYNFAGWFDENGNQISNGSTVEIGGDHTLFSRWTPKTYTLKFNGNGGNVSTASRQVSYGDAYGNLPTPSREGYSFAGWFTQSTGGNEVTSSTRMTTANAEIFAHWSANSYTLTFDDQGGITNLADMIDVSSATYKNGTYSYTTQGVTVTYQVQTNTLTLNGTATNSFTIFLSKGLELKEGDKFQVKYTYISGSPGESIGRIVIDACNEKGLNLASRNYINFKEPLVTSGSRTETLTITSAGAQGVGIRLWFWHDGSRTFNNYKIQFEITKVNGDDPNKQGSFKYDEVLKAVAIPTKYGYDFAGYFKGDIQYFDERGLALNNKKMDISNNDTTLTAKWEPKKNCVILFDGNGGTVSIASRNQTFGEALGELPVPKRDGYIFIGWFDARVGGSEVSSSYVMDTMTKMVFAQWADTWVNHTTKPTGYGNEKSPYLISTAENLAWLINNHATQYYQLTDHIDMSRYYWVSIGTSSKAFSGIFDGQGYAIKGLHTISQSLRRDGGGDNSGFIGVASGATIKNIYFEDIEINGKTNVAGVVGQITGTTTITSVAVVGEIYGSSRVLGIAGYSTNASYVNITDCLLDVSPSTIVIRNSTCNVTATDSVNYSTGKLAKTSGTFKNWIQNLTGMKYSMLPTSLSWIANGI